jgi:cytochrome oxidase Cu insertion factor (SCO1/SenC/PrrC family)
LQQVFEAYRDRGFTVLAINVEPEQRSLVGNVMTALGVEFVPLQSDWTWAEQNYGVKGTPETALVDQQGRIIFKPHVHDAETRAVLAREVEALLNRGR